MRENPFQLKERGIQILSLLKRHGPLSSRGLLQIVSPPIKERRLHASLARMQKIGLITKRMERVFRGSGIFYQISQKSAVSAAIAITLGCEQSELKQPYFVSRELLHSESCAIWIEFLEQEFSEALVVRDFEFSRNPEVVEILYVEEDDFEFVPDILLIFPKTEESPKVAVGLEIERTRKTELRIKNKLKKYANETLLDGVIYLCESDDVSKEIRRIYRSSILGKTMRINHYGKNFLLTQDELLNGKKNRMKMLNLETQYIFLKDWICTLRKNDRADRRDENFRVRAASCSDF
jgi:hypothetical protein